MLIKSIDRKGNAIPYSASEALVHAVARAAKSKNTLETVYWIDKPTVSLDPSTFRSHAGKDRVWEAWAKGTVHIGHTVAKTGLFHQPKPHTFDIHYKLGKDEWGIPDIKILEATLEKIERNPSKMVGDVPPPEIVGTPVGEVMPALHVEELKVEELPPTPPPTLPKTGGKKLK